MDLNALNQSVLRLIENGTRIISFLKDFTSSTPKDVSITYVNADGSEDISIIPNTAQFRKRVWDDVGAALGQFKKFVYVDELNGDDLNSGSSTSPFKTVPKAISTCPNGGTISVRLLSDCTFSSDVNVVGVTVKIDLNGYKLSLAKSYLDGKAILYSINGYNNTVYFYGASIAGSSVELPALGSDTLYSSVHSIFIKSQGSAEPELSQIHFGYGVDLQDNGDFYVGNCSSSVCSFSFSTDCTFTNVSGTREITDLVSGVIKDTNGVPRNIQSNLIF